MKEIKSLALLAGLLCNLATDSCPRAAGGDTDFSAGAPFAEAGAPGEQAPGDNSDRGVRPVTPRDNDPPHYCYRKRFAVCIGIDKYRPDGEFAPLNFAARDAIALAEKLAGACQFEHILLMCDGHPQQDLQQRFAAFPGTQVEICTDVTYRSIDDQARRFLNRATANDDLVLFFFAGHGHTPDGFGAMLLPSDFHPQHAAEMNIPIELACGYLTRYPVGARKKAVLIDACRSGHAMSREFVATFEGQKNQLAIIASCAEQQSSLEEAGLEHGRFTWALLNAMDAAVTDDGCLWIRDIWDKIFESFQRQGWSQQNPRTRGQDPQFFVQYSAFAEPKYFTLRCPQPAPIRPLSGADEVVKTRNAADEDYRKDRLEAAMHKYAICAYSLDEGLLPSLGEHEAGRRLAAEIYAAYARTLYRLGYRQASERPLAQAERLMEGRLAAVEVQAYRLLDGEKYAEAETRFRMVTEGAGRGQVTPFVWSRLGFALQNQEQYEPAAEMFQNAVAASERQDDRVDDRVEYSRLNDRVEYSRLKAVCLIQAGSDAAVEAIELHRAAVERQLGGRPGVEAGGSLRMAEIDSWKAVALERLGRMDEAANVRQAGRELGTKILGKNHPALESVLELNLREVLPR